MTRDVNTISKTATLAEAVNMMIAKKTNGLVVTNGGYKIVGILSSWDIIQYIIPDYLERDKHLASFESADLFAERAIQLAKHPVSKFMTKKVVTVREDHPLIEAATKLSEFHIRQLPVVDDKQNLVGYINRTDIKRAIGDALKNT